MKTFYSLLFLLVCATANGNVGTDYLNEQKPNGEDNDSINIQHLQEVVVKGIYLQANAPFAVANIKRESLNEFGKSGKELPFLFAQTPGITAWSENGTGMGTTHLRIRGAAGSRINVTLDGIPLNSPEDQTVFWANMNSYGTLLGNAQIQRGVGSSTNGDGAFGGTISLSSKTPSTKPTGELSVNYGSYNTLNWGGNFSTGLLWKKLILDAAYHQTTTDGYMHGTKGRSGSYYAGLTWIDDKFTVRYKNFGNFERTGQAWNGVTAGNGDLSLMDGNYCDENWAYDQSTGIKTYKDIYEAGLGRYNDLYERLVTDENGLFVRNADGSFVTERYKMSDGTYWKKTTDNFRQNHNILSAAVTFNRNWSAAASLHYTHGYGYYDEFRYNNKLSKFGLSTITDSEGNVIERSDFVREKGLTQDTYGIVANTTYENQHWNIVGGLSLQMFNGNHFGYITYVGNETLRNYLLSNGDYLYYNSDADKFDANYYVKAAYTITPQWTVFGDIQYRHIGYKTDGYNDKFIDNGDNTFSKHYLNIDKKYDFFNPKAGVSYTNGNHRAYASFAMSNREPERNNFTDNGNYPAPQHEQLLDYEVGYQYSSADYSFSANIYYMDYRNQFVQTGAKSDIGEPLTTNIKDSYRMGIELAAGCNITSWLSIEANTALSRNRIKNFDEVVIDWDNRTRTIHYNSSTLAFSPSVVSNGFINAHYKGFKAVFHSHFVSRQYLDNTANKDRSLPKYSTENLSLSYTMKMKKNVGVREAIFSLQWNNILNHHYAAGGWVYSAIAESLGHGNDNRYYQIGFIPMAGSTIMGGITLRF